MEPWIWLWQFEHERESRRTSGNGPLAMLPRVMSCSGMSVLRMTLLAQQRTRGDEELLVVRAVRRVTVDATVAHRRVLEQERAALLRVTGEADLVHAVGLEQRLGRAAVRIVTIDARDPTLEQRHMRAA